MSDVLETGALKTADFPEKVNKDLNSEPSTPVTKSSCSLLLGTTSDENIQGTTRGEDGQKVEKSKTRKSADFLPRFNEFNNVT